MSVLKHEIRHKQAQFNNLENTLLSGPRPLPPSPTAVLDYGVPTISFQKRPSLEGMSMYKDSQGDGLSPNGHNIGQDEIREGVPADFSSRSLSVSPGKRSGSPTRTWSRECKKSSLISITLTIV